MKILNRDPTPSRLELTVCLLVGTTLLALGTNYVINSRSGSRQLERVGNYLTRTYHALTSDVKTALTAESTSGYDSLQARR